MVLFGLLWIAAVASLPVQVTPASGDAYAAQLLGITEQGLRLDLGGQTNTLPLDQLRRLERSEVSDVPEPTLSAGLRGGSRIRAEGLRIEGETATFLMRRQDPLVLPLKQLDWVRFRAPSAVTDPDWLGIVGQQQVDDILVIRRSANAIDQAPGIVLSVDEEKVQFDLGGGTVPAPIAKLEGIVFANRSPQEAKGTTVTDVLGSQWAVETLTAGNSDGTITMNISGDIQRELKIEQIQTIRFSDGSTLLTGLQPVTSNYEPLVKSSVEQTLLSKWLGAKSVNDRDLILRSRSVVTYRVEPDATKFVALVSPDRNVEAGSGAVVRIRIADEIVWEQIIVPGDDAKGIELDVADTSRITLEVDYGDGSAKGDAGDVVRFLEPRFIK